MAKGVIVAAGYGTRFLPVTRVVPKELLPIVARPAIDLVVDELVEAGVDELLVITSRRKRALEDWFDHDPELEAAVAGSPRSALATPPRVHVQFVRQPRMGGTGDALRLARSFAGADPTLVAFPDDLFGAWEKQGNPCRALREVHAATGAAVLAAVDLGDADPSAYGVLDAHDDGRPGLAVRRVVEKPRPGEAPSRLASVGRYLYTPELFEALEESWARRPSGATGEFWPMEAMHALADRGRLRACLVTASRWDTGTPSGYLRAVVDHALADAHLGEEFGGWLRDRVRRL